MEFLLGLPNKRKLEGAGLFLWMVLTIGWVGVGNVHAATVGTVVPILGTPGDLAYDSTRKLVFIANTTQNRIEVYSLDRGQLSAPIPVGRRPLGIAVIPESNLLLVCNTDEIFLTVIDLTTLNPVGTIPVSARVSTAPEVPFSIAPLAGRSALLSTNAGLQLVDVGARTTRPIQPTGLVLPANVSLVSSGDRKYVLGQGGGILFLYDPLFPQGVQQIRPALSSSLIAADPTGARLMVGSAQFDRQLFQTAQVNPFVIAAPLGGVSFSADGATVFAGINQNPGANIQVLASSDLRRLSGFQVPEPVVGKMLASPAGDFLFAISLSGVLVVNLSPIPTLPTMEISQRFLYLSVAACNPGPQTRTIQITNSGGGSFSWKATSSSSSVTVQPSSGVGPSALEIKLDPTGSSFRGTGLLGTVRISSEESVSGDQTVIVLFNLRSPDQIGSVFPVEGFLSDILLDEVRERVYLVNSTRNQIEVFSTATQEFLAPVPVGSIPKTIAMSNDKRQLFLASLGTESITVLDAETLTPITVVRVPHPIGGAGPAGLPGTHPFSIAPAANGTVLLVAANLANPNRGIVYRLVGTSLTALSRLGSSSNSVNGVTFLASSGNGAFLFLVESSGNLYLYDAAAGDFVITRSFDNPVGGNVAASADGSRYHAGSQVLNFVLVPQDPIPSDITSIPVSVAGFAFAPSGTLAYRGIRPAGPAALAPRIEKLDTAALKLVSGFNIAEALAPNSTSPGLAIARQLAVNKAETVLYGITDSGFIVIPLPALGTGAGPQVSSGGVVSGASFTPAPSPVAPGSIVSIFGTNLAKAIFRPEALPLPTFLGGGCVTMDGIAAPFFFASPDQVNVQVPWEVSGRSSASVVVSAEGFASLPVTVNLAPQAPGIFTLSGDGRGTGAILHSSDFSLVGLSNPARIGEVVSIYSTGLGPTSPSVGTGQPPPDPAQGGELSRSSTTPIVTIGGAQTQVLFSGLTPHFVGLYQVDVRIPSNAPIGTNIPVVLTMGTRSSNSPTIAVVPASP